MSIVEGGDTRFALVVMDVEKYQEFFGFNNGTVAQRQDEIANAHSAVYLAAINNGQSTADANLAANQAVLKGSGVGLFQSTDDKKQEFTQVN